VLLAQADPASADARSLMDELDAELLIRYPGEATHGIEADEFVAAGGYFVIARDDDGVFAGCGAFRPLDATVVEAKRVFVRSQFRRRGISRAIMAHLEAMARERGFSEIWLETGNGQPEAIALYRSIGYSDISPFGDYDDGPPSIYLGKSL
jgi:GNAT superfamily N-acetyltransferase